MPSLNDHYPLALSHSNRRLFHSDTFDNDNMSDGDDSGWTLVLAEQTERRELLVEIVKLN